MLIKITIFTDTHFYMLQSSSLFLSLSSSHNYLSVFPALLTLQPIKLIQSNHWMFPPIKQFSYHIIYKLNSRGKSSQGTPRIQPLIPAPPPCLLLDPPASANSPYVSARARTFYRPCASELQMAFFKGAKGDGRNAQKNVLHTLV